MDTPNTQKSDVGVMGVSRSGRVRKKSSKLMDFQSPDDIETRHKKGAPHKQKNTQSSSNTSGINETFSQQHSQSNNQLGSNNNNANMFSSTDTKSDDEQLSSIEDFIPGENESFDSDIDIEDVAILDDEPVDDENDSVVDPTVRRSIYMTEKVVQTKTQRKDKGKTRVTAYMLWARDVRKQMLAQQPDLDFATISRRLGEMWANVPISEKCVWKRRAKRLANTILKKQNNNKEITNSKSPSKFLNKGMNANSKATKKILQSDDNMYIQQQQEQQHMNIECTTINLALPQSQSSKTSPIITPGIYKVTGIEPLDVAAHLKLLGDSLTIIGERLKEHEGQITVSGSLSVLLDSLLCSIGPLMCLTAQIRGLNDNRHLRESLRNTLDNIAYVMPGL